MKREMLKVTNVTWDQEVTTDTYGKLIVEPLERGMGITLGNALRRLLLGFVRGAAVTAVKIKGVKHEFSVIKGVYEDVVDIILNLRKLVIRLKDTGGPKYLTLKAEGACEVRADMIQTPPDVEILNKDAYIATLESDGKLEMEIEVDDGWGYMPAEAPRGYTEVGKILVDANFSPVTKVNFKVEEIPIELIPQERLILEVWTNGAITPQEAVKQMAIFLQDYLQIFVDFKPQAKKEEIGLFEFEKRRYRHLISTPLDELDFSEKTKESLKEIGITHLLQIVACKREDFEKAGFGKRALEEINEKLLSLGLFFDIGKKLGRFLDELFEEFKVERIEVKDKRLKKKKKIEIVEVEEEKEEIKEEKEEIQEIKEETQEIKEEIKPQEIEEIKEQGEGEIKQEQEVKQEPEIGGEIKPQQVKEEIKPQEIIEESEKQKEPEDIT